MASNPSLGTIANLTDNIEGRRVRFPGSGSQVFVIPPAKWEPCRCDEGLQYGKRCNKEKTQCSDVTRFCPIGSCVNTTTAGAGQDITTTETGSSKSSTLTPSPGPEVSGPSALLSGILGGVALLLLIVLLVVIIYWKRSRAKGDQKNSTCLPCFQQRKPDLTLTNPTYYPPEILERSHDQRHGNTTTNATYNRDPALYYNTDLSNHFYETVKPRHPVDEGLPPVPVSDSQTQIVATDFPADITSRDASGVDQGYEIPRHEYLELTDDGDYNRLGDVQLSTSPDAQESG